MPGGTGDLSFRLQVHARRFWLLVPVEIAEFGRLSMVLDTGSPRSAISGRVRDALEERGLLVHTGRRYVLTRVYTLTGLTIEGQSVDDLDVYVSPRVNELDIQGVPVDGLIGLDFLARFRQINFDFDSMRLTLTR